MWNEYYSVTSLEEALEVLAKWGAARSHCGWRH